MSEPRQFKQKIFCRNKPMTPGDEIVISGISGRFPNSANMQEFANNLYNKIDMVDDLETRWRHTNIEIPKRMVFIHYFLLIQIYSYFISVLFVYSFLSGKFCVE